MTDPQRRDFIAKVALATAGLVTGVHPAEAVASTSKTGMPMTLSKDATSMKVVHLFEAYALAEL